MTANNSEKTPGSESALVVLIPEAEELVSSFRMRFDPSAAWGVPAHVTVLYPFMPPQLIDVGVLATLKSVFGRFQPFDITFARIMDFPDTLFLEPEPREPFIKFTKAMTAVFPEYPPYGGGFSEIVPHLTVAQLSDTQKMTMIKNNFMAAANLKLPITSRVNAVTLMDELNGKWEVRAQFPLGGV